MPVSASPASVAPGGTVQFSYRGAKPHAVIDLQVAQVPGSGLPINGGGFQPALHQTLHNMPASFDLPIQMGPDPGTFEIQVYQDGGMADQTGHITVTPLPASASGAFVKGPGPGIGVMTGGVLHVFSTWDQYLAAGGRSDLSNVNMVDGATYDRLSNPAAALTPVVSAAPMLAVQAPAAAAAPVVSTAVYIAPPLEPASTDGQRLSMQDAPTQLYYLSNYGPGLLAATQFVLDHEHQLAAIGASQPVATTYAPPSPEPTATDGVGLSHEPLATSAWYVKQYGPGMLAASQYVRDRNAQIGTGPVTLAAGVGVGGPSQGISSGGITGGADAGTGSSGVWTGGASGWGSTNTPTAPNRRQMAAPAPSFGGLHLGGLMGGLNLSSLMSNKPLLLGAAAAGAYFLSQGKHRR